MKSVSSEPFSVLLVEDDPADAHLVQLAFRDNRMLVNLQIASDGLEALALLKDAAAPLRPALILLDLNMPRMDGREFLGAVKSDPALRNIPTVVLTTSDVERDVVASYGLGAAGYVTKPMDMDQFTEVIRSLTDYWFSLVRLPRP